jgi:hypothetical protein
MNNVIKGKLPELDFRRTKRNRELHEIVRKQGTGK